MKEDCVVVKFHDAEKYASSVCSGSKEECVSKAAYFRGVFREDRHVFFGIYPAWYIDSLQKIEWKGGSSLYELLTTTSYH